MAVVGFPGTASFGSGLRSAGTRRSRLSNSSWVQAWPGIAIWLFVRRNDGEALAQGTARNEQLRISIKMIVARKRFQLTRPFGKNKTCARKAVGSANGSTAK